MDALKFIRAQVAAKAKYLSSDQAFKDATFPEMSLADAAQEAVRLRAQADICCQILADIDSALPTTNRNAA